MAITEDEFFVGKRPWSRIKDQVLQDYMAPYLAKVQKLGRRILLIDGYAGPGLFDDGSRGSPLIMCDAAERLAKGKYSAFFMNNDQDCHRKLEQALRGEGWLGAARPILGDSRAHSRTRPSSSILTPLALKGVSSIYSNPSLLATQPIARRSSSR
jgi:hypothetical protein